MALDKRAKDKHDHVTRPEAAAGVLVPPQFAAAAGLTLRELPCTTVGLGSRMAHRSTGSAWRSANVELNLAANVIEVFRGNQRTKPWRDFPH